MRSTRASILRALLVAAGSAGALALSITAAGAVSDDVKAACKSDYLRHCSTKEVGSEELRQCMRSVGEDLSTPCLVALVKAGEVSKEDIERHKAQQAKAADAAPEKDAAVADKPAGNAKPEKIAKPEKNAKSAAVKSEPKVAAEQPSKKKFAVEPPAKKVASTQKPQKTEAAAKSKSGATLAVAKTPMPQSQVKKANAATRVAADEPLQQVAPKNFTHNLCRVTRLDGTPIEFTCGLDQRCCYMQLSNQEYCRPIDKPCF